MMTFLIVAFGLVAHGAPQSDDSGDPMFGRMIRLVEDRYLRLDEVDPLAAFAAAAEEAEGSIPWLIVDTDEGGVRLTC